MDKIHPEITSFDDPSKVTLVNRKDVDNIITWLDQSQYDYIFDLFRHKFSLNILYNVNEVYDQIMVHFNEVREEFIHSAESIMNTTLQQYKDILDNLNEIKKLRMILYIFNKLMSTFSLKIEQSIDNNLLDDNEIVGTHKLITTANRSLEFFYRYASILTMLIDKLLTVPHILSINNNNIFSKSSMFLRMWNVLHKTNSKNNLKKLHIDCLVEKLNDELKQRGEIKQFGIHFSYPPKSFDEIFKLTLIDTLTVDLPKLILMYIVNDLNYFYEDKFLSQKDMDYICDFISLNKSFSIILKQLWFCDNARHNEMTIFPFLQTIVLYDNQHLTTLKAYIVDNHMDRAINFANRFDFSFMTFEFNSIVVGLLCATGLYFQIVPFIQIDGGKPDYWHIIIYYSYEIETLFDYLVQSFFVLNNIDNSFIWQFIEYHLQKQSLTKLMETFSPYTNAYQYIIFFHDKMNSVSVEEKPRIKSILSNYFVKYGFTYPCNKLIEDNKNFPFSDPTRLNDNSSIFDGSIGLSNYLPVQSLDDSLGISMCTSLLNKSHDFKKKNIANMLHYSLQNSFKPTSILKRKTYDNRNSTLYTPAPKRLRFVIDGVVFSPGCKANKNLEDCYNASNSVVNDTMDSSSDDAEFFDALEENNQTVANSSKTPFMSSPYVHVKTTPSMVSTIFENHPPIAVDRNFGDVNIINEETSKIQPKPSLDVVATDLNQTFEKLSPNTECLDQSTNNFEGSESFIGNQTQISVTLCADNDANLIPTTSTLIMDGASYGSSSLPLPSILNIGSVSELLSSHDDANYNQASSTIDKEVKNLGEKIQPKPGLKKHRTKHKLITLHSSGDVDTINNGEEDDSPYNSVLEKRSHTKINETKCDNSLVGDPKISNVFNEHELSAQELLITNPTDLIPTLQKINNVQQSTEPIIVAHVENYTSDKETSLTQNVIIGNLGEKNIGIQSMSGIQTIANTIPPLTGDSTNEKLNNDFTPINPSDHTISTESGLVVKALPKIKKSSIKNKRNTPRVVATRNHPSSMKLVIDNSNLFISKNDITGNATNEGDTNDTSKITNDNNDHVGKKLNKKQPVKHNSTKPRRSTRKKPDTSTADVDSQLHASISNNISLKIPDEHDDSVTTWKFKTPKKSTDHNTKKRSDNPRVNRTNPITKNKTSTPTITKKLPAKSVAVGRKTNRRENIAITSNKNIDPTTETNGGLNTTTDINSPPVRILRSRTIRRG